MAPSLRFTLPGLVAAAALLSGCADDVPRAALPDAPQQERLRYVALGDSWTAAPLVGITRIDDGCLRSEENYPALLAADQTEIGEVVDVSCAAASTEDVFRPQPVGPARSRLDAEQPVVPPQLEAVTPDTDLVTIGLGGNDRGLFGRLARDCRLGDPTRPHRPAPGARCGDIDPGALAPEITRVGDNLARVLRRVRDAAPEATVVLVGYPRIVGADGCAPRLPVGRADAARLDVATRGLRDAMRTAARRQDALFLDMYAASRGHDVCSGSPWVNGVRTQPMTALALHPLAAGQRAVADRLSHLLFG